MSSLRYLLFGIYFGIVLVKTEVISWFRIQEMFRFDSFHMYGIIGLAVVVGAISILLIKRYNISSARNEEINLQGKPFTKGNFIGGSIFGLGWAMTGACPGPIYALIGSGYWIFIVVLFSALLGALTYGLLKSRLPH